MPATDPRQPRRSWKDDKPAAGKPGQGQRGWHKEPAAASGPKRPLLTRRGKIAVAVGGLFLGVIAFAVVMWFLDTIDAPRIVVIADGYETNLAVPPTVAAMHPAAQIRDCAPNY